jgi:Protein of unknown function (DUF3237)
VSFVDFYRNHPEEDAMPSLEYEFSYRASVKALINVGAGPYGNRNIAEVTGGDFEGPRLKGKILSGGADWALVGPDGRARLDVRTQLLTDDGATIYLAYYGTSTRRHRRRSKSRPEPSSRTTTGGRIPASRPATRDTPG